MRTKIAIAAKMLHDAWLHICEGRRDVAVCVAQDILMEAERRVRNGFGPVPATDVETLLAIENKYRGRIA